jgi:VanZ family protein
MVATKFRRNRTASRWESPLIDVGIWLIALVATGLTVWYSLGPRPPSHGSDKDLHAAAYFVDTLAILLGVVWRPGRETRRLRGGMLPVALGILIVGGVIEIAQGGFADRDAQFGDWVADAIGIGLAVLIFTLLRMGVRSPSSKRIKEPLPPGGHQ